MSPEQILGKEIDHRADIYALGMTLYVMLAGRAPFDEDETSEFILLKSCMEDEIPDPREFYPYIPDGMVKIIMELIDKDPKNRHDSCDNISYILEQQVYETIESYQLEEKEVISLQDTKKGNDKAHKKYTRYHSTDNIYRKLLKSIHTEIYDANPTKLSAKFKNEIDLMLSCVDLDIVKEIDDKLSKDDAEYLWLKGRILEKLELPVNAQKYFRKSYNNGFLYAKEFIEGIFIADDTKQALYIILLIAAITILLIFMNY